MKCPLCDGTVVNGRCKECGMKKYDDWGVNLPIIRIEDMKLLYAEILAMGGML